MKLYFSLFLMHMHQQSFHQPFYFLLSFSIMGITILPLHTLLLNADILIKQTYQFLTIHILLSFLLLYVDCLQVQYLPHLLQVRFQPILGLISNDSLVPLFKCVILLTNRIISCKCLLSKLNCFIIHILN